MSDKDDKQLDSISRISPSQSLAGEYTNRTSPLSGSEVRHTMDPALAAELGLSPSEFLEMPPLQADEPAATSEFGAKPDTLPAMSRLWLNLRHFLKRWRTTALLALLVTAAALGIATSWQQKEVLYDLISQLDDVEEQLSNFAKSTPVPTPTATPSQLLIGTLETSAEAEILPADEQASTGIHITLLDQAANPYQEPKEVFVQIVSGGGLLEHSGQKDRALTLHSEMGQASVSYWADRHPGPVLILVQVGEKLRFINLTLADVTPKRLEGELATTTLQADGISSTVLIVRVLNAQGETVFGLTQIELRAEPPGLVTWPVLALEALDGMAIVPLTAGKEITKTAQVTLTVIAEDLESDQLFLTVEPFSPPPPQCKILDIENRKLYKEEINQKANALLDMLPPGLIVRCAPQEGWSDSGVPIEVTAWVPLDIVKDGVLAPVAGVSLKVNVEGDPANTGQKIAFYEQDGMFPAEGYSIAETGQQTSGWIEIRITGLVSREAVELLPE